MYKFRTFVSYLCATLAGVFFASGLAVWAGGKR